MRILAEDELSDAVLLVFANKQVCMTELPCVLGGGHMSGGWPLRSEGLMRE